jgi:hypothetical protein
MKFYCKNSLLKGFGSAERNTLMINNANNPGPANYEHSNFIGKGPSAIFTKSKVKCFAAL